MEPKQHRLAESLRSGLSRLRRFVQRHGTTRCVVIHLFAHVLLFRVVEAVLLLRGFPMRVAEVGAVILVVLVAKAIETYVDTKLEER